MEDFQRSRRMRIEFNVISIVDIMLVLMIYFLIAGSMEKIEIVPVELPAARSGKVLDEGEIVIVLGRYGEVLMGDDLTDMDGLRAQLPKRIAAQPNIIVSLKTDAEIPAHHAIEVMEMVRAAGGKNISLVTQGMEN